MISEILPITQTKLKILINLYIYDELNLAELSNKLTMPSPNILKSLPSLKSILNIKELGNIKLYSINSNYIKILEPLIEEYRLEISLGIHSDLIKRIQNINDISNLYIYGSYVKGQVHKESDLDLLIITNKKKEVDLEIANLKRLSSMDLQVVYLDELQFERELNNLNSRFGKIFRNNALRIKIPL